MAVEERVVEEQPGGFCQELPRIAAARGHSARRQEGANLGRPLAWSNAPLRHRLEEGRHVVHEGVPELAEFVRRELERGPALTRGSAAIPSESRDVYER